MLALPPATGINQQYKPSWPWIWNGSEAVVPSTDGEGGTNGEPVYCLRVRGTADLELAYEIVQPDGTTDSLSVALRRSIGLVRLSGDDRNDRDLRLVQGSALDRLLSDKRLRSRLASELSKSDVKDELTDNAKCVFNDLDLVFKEKSLPDGLDLAITGGQGFSITALIGLTAERDSVQLPLASWGAGTRRLAALAIAAWKQGEAPITLVDEIERGLEPYRQRSLMENLQSGKSQAFLTTHSPSAISAASNSDLWYVDHAGGIGRLEDAKTARHRKTDPETFLARLTVVAEGATELGFVTALLEKALGSSLEQHGVHVSDGGGHEATLGLLEALAAGGLRFGGFADDEGKHPTRWENVAKTLDKLLFRWTSGSIEENVIGVVADDRLEVLLTDPEDDKTGMRLRTLAERLGIQDKDFETIKAKAGSGLKALILDAALGTVPADKSPEKRHYQSHAQTWFKSVKGGRELAGKVFSLGMWPSMQPKLMPFLQRRPEGGRPCRNSGPQLVSDDSVRAALRSDAPLVVVEAPAGCGKTHQGADYAREKAVAIGSGRLLILTHTHAACSVFSDRTKTAGSRVEIRTIDSAIAHIASAYHAGLGLPADTAAWVRQRGEDGYAELALKIAALLKRHPMIAASLVQRYPVIICDEHQDSSGDQHSVVMALLEQGAWLRMFADPMQKIFNERAVASAYPPCDWNELTGQAQAFETLDTPHRWSTGCPELGLWTQKARNALMAGSKVDLRSGLPPSVNIVFAENQAQKNLEYQLSGQDRKRVDQFEQGEPSLLILTRHNRTARSFRGFFNRRIPLWEGHTRSGLEKLVTGIQYGQGNPEALAAALVTFMGDVGKGFSPSAFGDRFEQEARDGCAQIRRGKAAKIQELARFLVAEPDHRGVAKMLRRLSELKTTDLAFADVETDCRREFWDAVQLGNFDTADAGLAEVTHRRTYSRPKPPEKAISTIHKAKGLECDSVIVMPCDARTFPDKPDARCLLYVALSRAKSRVLLVLSTVRPSPLFTV